jgi:hypothetical protein
MIDTPSKDMVLASRDKLLSESALPRMLKPTTDTEEDRREQLRSDKVAPSWATSITDSANKEPNLDIPISEIEDPMRAKPLSESVEPRGTTPSTDTEAAIRAKLLSDTADPRLVISKTDRENKEPSLVMPKTETAEPTREKVRNAIEEPPCM